MTEKGADEMADEKPRINLKKFPFSQAYPLTSLSFVFGMIAAWLVFGESIPFSRWIGLVLVVLGCFLIMK